MHKKNKIPDFSIDELLTSMGQGADHAAGKITARTHQLTARAEAISAIEIAAIREHMNVSQAVFADLLNVPKATAVSWERGLRSPSGAAVRLLQIAKNRPKALIETAAHPLVQGKHDKYQPSEAARMPSAIALNHPEVRQEATA